MSTVQRLFTALAIVAMTLGSVAAASEEVAPTPASETLYVSAGCPQDTPGTCTSTRWLGHEIGDARSNFLTATTPVDEVLYRVDGSINWRDYPSDTSLRREGYPLRAEEAITATVTVVANAVAVNNTVHARLEARTADGRNVTFGPLQETVTVPPQGEEAVTFAFAIPDELDGVALRSMTFFTAVHGVNAQGGYIDQAGGSTVEIPYWAEPQSP
jgi:hypothetical protein